MNAVEGASKDREFMEQEANNPLDFSAASPAGYLAAFTQQEYKHSKENLPIELSPVSGVCSVECGASGRGRIAGNIILGTDNSHAAPLFHRFFFARKCRGPTEDDVLGPRSSEIIASRDLSSEEGGCYGHGPE